MTRTDIAQVKPVNHRTSAAAHPSSIISICHPVRCPRQMSHPFVILYPASWLLTLSFWLLSLRQHQKASVSWAESSHYTSKNYFQWSHWKQRSGQEALHSPVFCKSSAKVLKVINKINMLTALIGQLRPQVYTIQNSKSCPLAAPHSSPAPAQSQYST